MRSRKIYNNEQTIRTLSNTSNVDLPGYTHHSLLARKKANKQKKNTFHYPYVVDKHFIQPNRTKRTFYNVRNRHSGKDFDRVMLEFFFYRFQEKSLRVPVKTYHFDCELRCRKSVRHLKIRKSYVLFGTFVTL